MLQLMIIKYKLVLHQELMDSATWRFYGGNGGFTGVLKFDAVFLIYTFKTSSTVVLDVMESLVKIVENLE